MKPISCEVLTFPISERMRKKMNQLDVSGSDLVVESDDYAIEDVLSASDDASCGFCRREEHTQSIIIAGHTVNICSDCLATITGRIHA